MSGLFTEDRWLGELLGKPAYRAAVPAAGFEEELVRLGDPDAPVFCELRLPPTEVPAMIRAQRAGFFLVDTNIYFEGPAPATDAGGWTIRPAMPRDAAAVGQIAQTGFRFSRFHQDPWVSPDTAAAIKRAWALNYFSGKRGDLMLVAEDQGRVCGFLQLLRKDGGLWVIDLVAVEAAVRGRGAGKALLGAMARHCPGLTRAGVGTQAANISAAAFYERAGFRLARTIQVFHYHRGAR